MISTPILVAAVHGGWWGAVAAGLTVLAATYPHARPDDLRRTGLVALAATAALRLLYNFPGTILGVIAAVIFVVFIYHFVRFDPEQHRKERAGETQTPGTSPDNGTFRKLRNVPPRGANPVVAAVLAAEDYYQVLPAPTASVVTRRVSSYAHLYELMSRAGCQVVAVHMSVCGSVRMCLCLCPVAVLGSVLQAGTDTLRWGGLPCAVLRRA